MKIILIILAVIALLAVLLLAIAAFMKKEYYIEREIVINKPKSLVFDYLKMIKNQSNYNKWTMTDPNAKMEYRGTDGTAGFVSAWDSENKQVGKGEQQITKITEGERIDMEIHFIKPFEGRSNAFMSTDSISADQTKVKWGFTGKMKYPMNIMLLFMNLPEMLGKDLDTSLGNLKIVLEK